MGKFIFDVLFIKYSKLFLVLSGYAFFGWIDILKNVSQPSELFKELSTWVLILTVIFYLLGIVKRVMDIFSDRKNQKQKEINDKIIEETLREKLNNDRFRQHVKELLDNDDKLLKK